MTKDAVIDVVHKTIYGFFDVVADDSEEPISEKDKLLLEVNKAVCNAVEEMPDGERKTGRWISHIEHGIYGNIQCWVCSECRELFSYDAETGVEMTNYHICPNCGAKMEGAEE